MQVQISSNDYTPIKNGHSVSSDAALAYLRTLVLTTDDKRTVADSLFREAMREDAQAKMGEQYRLKKDMELFASYKDNWDGEGGLPLTEQVIQNFECLLPLISTTSLKHIDVYPENNGSLLILSRTQEAGLNIGNDTYTYYITHGTEVTGESHLAFTIDDVLNKIEEIAG